MISKLSSIITDYFICEKIISFEEKDIYEYGTELFFSAAINTLLLFSIGILAHYIAECAIFYIVFCFMRLYCGGFHADTYTNCTLLFIGVFANILIICEFLSDIPNYYWFVLLLFSNIVMIFLSPIENSNKPLDFVEKKKYRRISIIEMLIWSAITVILFLMGSRLYRVITLTLFSVSILMLYAVFKEGGKSREVR